MSYVLAIDFGTSGCRSAVYNARLEMLSSAIEEYPLILHSETEIEQDADLWWEKAKKTIRAAVAASGVPTSEICALSISSQGIAFVPIDRSGKTLFHAISWLDTRAEAETEALAARYGMQALYTRTGKRLSDVYTLPKLIWCITFLPLLPYCESFASKALMVSSSIGSTKTSRGFEPFGGPTMPFSSSRSMMRPARE